MCSYSGIIFLRAVVVSIWGLKMTCTMGNIYSSTAATENSVCISCDREQWPIVWVNIVLNTCNFAMPSDP